MARPKKIVADQKPIQNKELVLDKEQVLESDKSSNEKTENKELVLDKELTKCEVLIPFTDRKEFGGLLNRKGDIKFLSKERLENAVKGRLVKIID